MTSKTSSSSFTADETSAWTMRLSVMDMRMNAYSFRALYVFPSLTGGQQKSNSDPASDGESKAYDIMQLRRSFEQLLREDYPFLIDGEMHVDPETNTICLLARHPDSQTTKPLLEFDTVASRSTRDAMASLDFSLVSPRDSTDLIAVKCTFLNGNDNSAGGGLAIGLNINHCMFDAEGCFTFMRQWGMHYRQVEKAQRPVISHARHLLFESSSEYSVKFDHPEYTIVDGMTPSRQARTEPFPATTSRVFHMSCEELRHLKAFVAGGLDTSVDIIAPAFVSTIDALTALMTLLITRARGHGHSVNIGTAVNGRCRLEPRLPDNYAGNVVFTAFSSFAASELQCALASHGHRSLKHPLAIIARRIRQTIQYMDSAFMRDTVEFLASHRHHHVEASTRFLFGADIMFSSWLKLGCLDADFGARPLCVSSPALPVCDGVVVFQESECDGGVDVLVYLEVGAMSRLEGLWTSAAGCCWTASCG